MKNIFSEKHPFWCSNRHDAFVFVLIILFVMLPIGGLFYFFQEQSYKIEAKTNRIKEQAVNIKCYYGEKLIVNDTADGDYSISRHGIFRWYSRKDEIHKVFNGVCTVERII